MPFSSCLQKRSILCSDTNTVTPPSYTMYKYAHLYVGNLSNANSLSLTLEKRKVEENLNFLFSFENTSVIHPFYTTEIFTTCTIQNIILLLFKTLTRSTTYIYISKIYISFRDVFLLQNWHMNRIGVE